MKNTIKYLCIIALSTIFLFASCTKDSDQSKKEIASYENAKLYLSANQKFYIAELHGSFRLMGQQYGSMMKEQIKKFYDDAVSNYLMKEKKIKYDLIKSAGNGYYNTLPQMYKDFVDGIGETNGLNKEQTNIVAALPILLAMSGCSSLSAWGEYTGGGPLVVGRNWDLPTHMTRFSKYLTVVVFNPDGSGNSIANIDFAGSFFYQTAMNNKGIFLELQNGQGSDTTICGDRSNANHALFNFLLNSSSIQEIDALFKSTLPGGGIIMNASSPSETYIYEWGTSRLARRNGKGLISASNDFIDPSWAKNKMPVYNQTNEGIGKTYTRRTNLLARGAENKGKITPDVMKKIFDTTIPNNGATFPDDGLLRTVYQVVAVPTQQKIWLKARGYSDWEEIDLTKYFSKITDSSF